MDHGEPIEADLQGHYGLSLEHLGWPEFPWRKLGRLLSQLPEGSRTAMAVVGEDAWWTQDRHLFASAIDSLHTLNWQMGSGKKGDKPKPVPRPGVKSGTKKIGDKGQRSPAEVRALLDSMKPRKAVDDVD